MVDTSRRIERIEERLNKAEQDVAALTSKLQLSQTEMSRRIDEININLKEDAEKIRVDLRERLSDLKVDLKEDIEGISSALLTLNQSVSNVSKSLQELYVTQKGSSVKVNTNERVIWGIVGVLGTIALYFIQSYIRGTPS